MLDQDTLNQLKEVFSKLENEVELVLSSSDHEDFASLEEMLSLVASTSDKIKLTNETTKASAPEFYLKYNGNKNGIRFLGIPGGHEFTSLILAILNSDAKGKIPDAAIISRIKKLKGPVRIKTFISLSCENCPDVVQALNLMAIFHSDFEHQMIDGQYAQDEIKSLGIQGVPSVIVDGKLIHSGKIQFADLLSKLEATFGVDENVVIEPSAHEDVDVAVIGGGPAGATSAIYSVRKGQKTAIIAGKIGGQVNDTKGIENFVSTIYTEGPILAANLHKHLESYPVKILEHRSVSNIVEDNGFIINFDSGERIKAKSVIVATGAKWRELNIPGEKEYIGRGVAFCPHCDGPYYKGKDIAVVGGGNSGVEAALDLAGIVKSITLFEFMPDLKADKVLVDKLRALPNVTIISNARTSKVVGDGEKVIALEYENRETKEIIEHKLDGVFVQIGLVPNTSFVKDLVETTKFGEIIIDEKNRTNVKGIYAAGDVTNIPYKQIIIAMGEGAKAALTAFEDKMFH